MIVGTVSSVVHDFIDFGVSQRAYRLLHRAKHHLHKCVWRDRPGEVVFRKAVVGD